jgi:two-component system, OmpR family, sensor histidine kinase CreC
VSKTLKGEYGARTTRQNPEDELTSVMYVAAPIYYHQELLGVFTVMQPNGSSLPFLEFARQQLITQGSLILMFALLLGGLMSYWLTHSVRRLADYVQRVRRGERVALPKLYERELAALADATEAMRRELEGKAYIENYVHSLTHEMKSPLAGIRGAAELIDEGVMDAAEQHKFLRNIINSSHRMQYLIDRLLALAALENTYELTNRELLYLPKLIAGEVAAKSSQAQQKNIRIDVATAPVSLAFIKGDAFLLGQALSNLLDNALNFAARDSCIQIQLTPQGGAQCISISNQGSWIPDYALARIFERFYSLARPDGAGKSSGLGLSFVKEVVELHAGTIELLNLGDETAPQVVAYLCLPE